MKPGVHTRGSTSSLLLAFNGAALAGLASTADHGLPLATKVAGALAVFALGAAAVLLLLVVRPRLRGDDRASFPHWARLDEDEIRACMDSDTRAARVRVLSVLAVLALFTTSDFRQRLCTTPGGAQLSTESMFTRTGSGTTSVTRPR